MLPFPACRMVRGVSWEELQGRPGQGRGGGNLLQLGIKTEQVQRNKALIYIAAAPASHNSGPPPSQGLPSKKLDKAGARVPSGNAQNSEK